MAFTCSVIGEFTGSPIFFALKSIGFLIALIANRQFSIYLSVLVVNLYLSILSEIYEDISSNIVFAYEPVWAIGTGVTATSDMISIVQLHKDMF